MASPSFSFAGEVSPVCEIGMSETRQSEPTSWLDVSCFVHEAELFRGRERFNERFEPGTASVTFANDDGWADLGGTYAQVAAAPLRPGRQIRVGVHGPWNPGMAPFVRWLYRGFIDQATPAYDPVRHDTVTVNCIDALGEAGSSTAPAAEHQGIGEIASARINRVLDAVGWWSSKRKIDATVTTVQGTSLGSSAIDHMGQASDSAGGVVFGDLDGDVVFRDIDWMLYDPDVPPDATIGPGTPGAPPGDTPPYINPSEGPVFDPDDPPTLTPPKVCVCADGTAGTLIEKGDNYRLYVRGGHLFYESSGHTWDLGPYSGGCTCVDPPSGGGGGGGGPVRTDDGVINPFPPVELPAQFGVELLAWDDANTEEVVSAVTVGGVTPGHDCLLVAMVNAIADTTNTGYLAPVVTGGGLEWTHRRDVNVTGTATAVVAVAAVGRTDPGTFSVVATWAAPQTSRTHIVTVWKVTAAADDYLERFDAGAILYALTASNPPEVITPGDGPVTVPLAADRQPAGQPATTRAFDITIAQTLADDEHGPYGAEFDTATGPWTLPSNVPPQLGAVTLAAEWLDDFERADGAIGPNWTLAPTSGFVPDSLVYPFTIEGGAAVGNDVPNTFSRTSRMHWAAAQDADQSIAMVVDHAIDNNGYLTLYTHGNDTDQACVLAEFNFFDSGTPGVGEIGVYLYHFGASGSSPLGNVSIPYPAVAGPIELALQSDADGLQRVYVGGAMVLSVTDPTPPTGAYTGIEIGVATYLGSPYDSPRILSAGSHITAVRKASWVAGWRQGVTSNVVGFADVNFGDDDNQSTQSALVLESGESTSGHRLLGYQLRADTTGVTAAGTLAFNSPPRPGALVVVFVGATASSDVLDSISVTGADFTRSFVRTKSGSSLGQGAVWIGVAPLDFNPAGWNVVVSYPGVESISAAVYEVTLQDDTVPVGVHASNVLGTNIAGSVNGASTITLTGAGDAAAIVLAYLHASADPSGASGASAGSGWTQELVHSPSSQRGYMQTMSRPSGSTSTAVVWADVQTGSASAYSAVQLAVEIHPYDGLATTAGGSGVYLGGVNDPFNGTIGSATAYDPVTSIALWTFP